MNALTVCNHDVMSPSKTLGKLLAKCGMCGRRKKWPFAKMVKCCQCKKLWHAKCLPAQTHSSPAIESTARTERQPRTQQDSVEADFVEPGKKIRSRSHGSLRVEDFTISLSVNLRMRGKDYTLLPDSNPIRLLPQRDSRHNQRQERKSENSEDFLESKKKVPSESDPCTIRRFHRDSNKNSWSSQASDPVRFLSLQVLPRLDQITIIKTRYLSDSALHVPVYKTKNSCEHEEIYLTAGSSNNNVRPSELNTRTISHSFTPPKMSMNDFTLLKLLGRGNFGEVLLCQHKTSNKYFAIKALEKYKITNSYSRAKYLHSEKRIFQIATENRNPFLTNMFGCFQTDAHVCFVMEYVAGGDLTTHLEFGKGFDEPTAVFYAACMVLGLQYLHEKRVIHRDVKLLNVLMDAQGYVKIADFGFCKEGIGYGDRTNSLCGTPYYTAPEMLRLLPSYTRSVDWWGFGIVVYEMLVGDNPFERFKNRCELFKAIANVDVYYPDRLSSEALSILKGLLNKNPDGRLGSSERDAEDIKEQPFFKQIVWGDLSKRKVKPPYVPTPTFSSLKHASYFGKKFTDEELQLDTSILPISLPYENQDIFEDFSYTAADWFQQEE